MGQLLTDSADILDQARLLLGAGVREMFAEGDAGPDGGDYLKVVVRGTNDRLVDLEISEIQGQATWRVTAERGFIVGGLTRLTWQACVPDESSAQSGASRSPSESGSLDIHPVDAARRWYEEFVAAFGRDDTPMISPPDLRAETAFREHVHRAISAHVRRPVLLA